MTKINKITVTGKNNVPKIITNGIENIWNIPTNNVLGIAILIQNYLIIWFIFWI
jgi:hypothetical protein